MSKGRRRGLAARALIGACVLAMGLAACGDSEEESGAASGGESASVDYQVAVLSVGNKTDGAFGQALAEGAANAGESTGAEVDYVGNLNTPDQYVSQGTSYAQAGYDMVLVGHGAMGPVAIQLAKKFPETTFCHTLLPFGPGSENLPPNACFFYTRGELGAFRAGALAGLVTESDVIGSNQALVFPALTVQVNDFILGAQCTNPDAKVLTAVTNSDVDPSPTKTASEAQIAKGADVLFGATGTAMAGVFQAASEHEGVYAIGQYVDASSSAPDAVLASTIVNFQESIPFLVEQGITGDLPQTQVMGTDMPFDVGYLKVNDPVYEALPAGVREAYEEVDQAISDGTIEVPTPDKAGQPDDWKKFDAAELGCSSGA